MAASSVAAGPLSAELHTLRGSPAPHSSSLSGTPALRYRPSGASQTDSVPIDRLSLRHLLTLKQRAYEHYALILQRCGITSETRPFSTFILAGFNSQTNANASWSWAKKRQQSKGSTPSSAAQSARTSQNASQPGSPNQTITTPLKGLLTSSSREEAPTTTEAQEADGVFTAASLSSVALLNSIQRESEFLNSSKSAASCCSVFEVPLSILQAHFDDALPPCIMHTMSHIDAELQQQCSLEAEKRKMQAKAAADARPNTGVEVATAATTSSQHSEQSKVVGVFRRAGLRTRIVEIRSLFDSQPTLAAFSGGPFTEALLFDYCDVLKQFFRDLPECLLTNPVSHFLLAVANSPEFSQQNGQNENLRLETLHCAFMLLADANRRALRTLFKFLQRVASHEAETNMNLYNLAVCFCPSLFDFSNTGASTLFAGAASGAGGAGNNPTTIGVQWIITMIQHANLLFSIPRQVYEAWVIEERLALERLRTAQSAVSTKVGAKDLKQRDRPGYDWRRIIFIWRSKAPRDLEPVASLFVRPITYKRGDAMRFEELGSRLLNGRINFMLFIDYACQTLEKASDSDAAQRQHSSRQNGKTKQSSTARSSSPAASPTNAHAHPVKPHLNRIWLQYSLPELVAFDTSGIELCAKRSKMERKKLKEAAASSGGAASTAPNTATPTSNSSPSFAASGPTHTFDSLEQQALIAYPSIAQADRNSALCDDHSAALWRVRFELPEVPVSRLADALWKASFFHDVFDLELVETIEQLSGDAVLERLRRTGPVDRHIREYSVLRARREHFSVAVPEALAFVLTSVVEYEANLSKPTVPHPFRQQKSKPDTGNQDSLLSPVEHIQDAVICDLNILVEPAGTGSHVMLLNREELRGYTHEWYTLVWPVVLARWAVRFREYFTTAV